MHMIIGIVPQKLTHMCMIRGAKWWQIPMVDIGVTVKVLLGSARILPKHMRVDLKAINYEELIRTTYNQGIRQEIADFGSSRI